MIKIYDTPIWRSMRAWLLKNRALTGKISTTSPILNGRDVCRGMK